MRVVIVGLPLFAKRLSSELSKFDPDNQYIFLDTYYSKWDKLKALWYVPKADIVFSINGSMSRSKVFDTALRNKAHLIMNWVGTDVLKSTEAVKSGNFVEQYRTKAHHFCEVDWIQQELLEIGVQAEIVNFAAFDQQFEVAKNHQDKLTVLTYIPKDRQDFYGAPSILKLAKSNPDVQFIIAGSDKNDYTSLPTNIDAMGWVTDMAPLFKKAHVAIRFTEHDGLSNFILESLARGKQVIYNNQYNYCKYASNDAELQTQLDKLKESLVNGEELVNVEGMKFIEREFNSEVILGNLVKKFSQLHAK